MFGKSSPPPPPEDAEPPFDYGAAVERELRIADNLGPVEKLWAEILSDYLDYARTLVFVRLPRDRRR